MYICIYVGIAPETRGVLTPETAAAGQTVSLDTILIHCAHLGFSVESSAYINVGGELGHVGA